MLKNIRQICINKQTQQIAKHGHIDSFESTCQQFSSGTLTSKAIASELLRRGEISDSGRKYKVVNMDIEPEENSIVFFEELRNILPEIQRICTDNDTKFIAKTGADSFESACLMNQSGLFSIDKVAKYLIDREFIIDLGKRYQINKYTYIIHESNLRERLNFISLQLSQLIETMLCKDEIISGYNMRMYSTQTRPKNNFLVKTKIREILKVAYKKTQETLEEYEEDVPFNTYPPFGTSMFIFDESNNMDEQ